LTNLAGVIEKDTAPIGVLNQLETATIYSTISSAAGTSDGITKYAFGILILAATNTYSGPTTIEGGILQLGAPQVLPPTSPLILANGGTEGYFNTAAKLKTAGFSQDFGPLSIIGGSPYVLRTLDFGAGDCALAFADSHDQDWNGIPLTIVNYTPGSDTLRFGTNASGLTPAQLASIIFMDQSQIPGEIDAQGFVTPAYPRVLSVQQVATTTFRLTWNAIPERSYQVQYKTSPDADGWNDAGEAITAEDTIASFDDEAGSDQARFYRIVLTPYQPAS
jgi:autotransporter-associated beta strand protein